MFPLVYVSIDDSYGVCNYHTRQNNPSFYLSLLISLHSRNIVKQSTLSLTGVHIVDTVPAIIQ